MIVSAGGNVRAHVQNIVANHTVAVTASEDDSSTTVADCIPTNCVVLTTCDAEHCPSGTDDGETAHSNPRRAGERHQPGSSLERQLHVLAIVKWIEVEVAGRPVPEVLAWAVHLREQASYDEPTGCTPSAFWCGRRRRADGRRGFVAAFEEGAVAVAAARGRARCSPGTPRAASA